MTSSGAFFDPRAVSKKSLDGLTDPRSVMGGAYSGATAGGAQSDIIAQLTREMKLQQGSGSASGLFSGSSDANVSSSSSGLGSSSHLNQLIASQNPNTHPSVSNSALLPTSTSVASPMTMSQQIIAQLNQDAAKLSKMSSSDVPNLDSLKSNLHTTAITSGIDISSDNSLSDLTGVGKSIQKSSTSSITAGITSSRLPLPSTTSLLLSNNSSITSLNASTAAALHTSSLAGHLPSNITSGIPDFTSSLLHQQAQLESLKAELATVEGGTSSRPLSNGTKLAPDKLELLSRSQPDLFTGLDGAGLASKEGMF